MKWRLGRFAGINVYVHWSFWILPALVLMSTMVDTGLSSAVNAVVVLFAAFACVVLHEYGHALTARAFGVGTRDITLYPIGGVARLERIPRNPSHELAIAAAGPAVNVVIAGVLGLILLVTRGVADLNIAAFTGGPLLTLLTVNIALVVFNLLPAFPMDGGRILRALLAMVLPYADATTYAARTGQVVAVLLGVAGLSFVFSPVLLLIAAFVFVAAQAELNAVRRQKSWADGVENTVYERPSWTAQSSSPHGDGDIVWVEDTGIPTRGDSDAVRIVRYGYWRPK